MNAPHTPSALAPSLASVSLDDKYTVPTGRVFMSGVQALVRLPMLQRVRDAAAGLNTAGFISGYRGSPLGGYDQALWQAQKHLASHHIVFQPGVNEELGATAVWGTQQLDLFSQQARYDGVFGLWYGKGPGVDRCVDVFKHANMAGTSRHGGVVAVAGDDHVSKSSTAPHQSDHVFKACGFPTFFPSGVQDILDMGLHAFAMSRFAGVWTGMKTIQEVVESSTTVDVTPDRVKILLPEDFPMPPGGLHIRWPDPPLEQEARLMDHKWYAALAYVRANRLNHDVISGPTDRFGIIASGKAFNDTRQALADLGLDEAACHALGVRLHKVNVVWPLEASITRQFAQGLQEILVVEEKRQIIEYQLKEELYNWRADVRPNVIGKFDESEAGDLSGGEWSWPNPSGHWLLRAKADLSPALIAKAIAKRLHKMGVPADVARRMDERIAIIEAKERAMAALLPTAAGGAAGPGASAGVGAGASTGERVPWFCSGCPHNTSTRVPEGSRAVAGIGCHYMVNWMPGRHTSTFTQMGGEGVPWVGQAPFTHEKHIFANLGDGTYFHSGLLAIRQSIAAGVNITYKILCNDAVAMTGGQRVGERPEGHSVLQIMKSVLAEGATRVALVSDEPARHPPASLPPGVSLHHRDALDALQREFREIAGTTVLIYEQTCATEKRRRRKRGTLVDPAVHMVINPAVCEGCGDCSVQSNCVSVEPLETPLGRKRQINQSSCNKDFSCAKGFCPSFVSVEGGTLRKPHLPTPLNEEPLPPVPEPTLPTPAGAWGVVVAGIGGTGVITIGQLLGMAAHLEGKGIVTQDAAGLAQKGGATWSHVQIAAQPQDIHTTKVDTAKADLVIGCDAIVAAHRTTLAVLHAGRSQVVLNTHRTPTASFIGDPDWQFPASACETALRDAVGPDHLGAFDADAIATRQLGDAIYTNPLLLGFAWQRGCVPLQHASLMRAIELNGVQVEKNKLAFEWGRRCAHDLAAVQAGQASAQIIQLVRRPSLDEWVEQRCQDLAAYQDAAYALRYRSFVDRVRMAERPQGGTALTEAVARQLFHLMAYKDEYEVARLHTSPAFKAQIAAQFEGPVTLRHHLAPPLWPGRDADGHPRKRSFGPWIRPVFQVLRRMKFLRGTVWDPFGHTAERRAERALIDDYCASIAMLLPTLNLARRDLALQIARLPQTIRGFGHVKARQLAAVRPQWEALLRQWDALDRPPPRDGGPSASPSSPGHGGLDAGACPEVKAGTPR